MTDTPVLESTTPRLILQEALKAEPLMTLEFWPYGIVLRHRDGPGMVEKIVAPDDLADVLAKRPVQWRTGILHANVLYMASDGAERILVEYRPPQITGIWLEGTDEPLRVPLPPLVLVRTWTRTNSRYRLVAVKERPADLQASLFLAPLPNVGHSGICWGNVERTPPADNDLTPIWAALLGSRFGDHSVNGKSVQHKDDIRKLLIALDGQDAYPLDDLIASNRMLSDLIEGKV